MRFYIWTMTAVLVMAGCTVVVQPLRKSEDYSKLTVSIEQQGRSRQCEVFIPPKVRAKPTLPTIREGMSDEEIALMLAQEVKELREYIDQDRAYFFDAYTTYLRKCGVQVPPTDE